MTIETALDRIVREDQDFFTLIQALYTRRYTGTIILHCHNGRPTVAEFPSAQVRLADEGLTIERSSRTLSPST